MNQIVELQQTNNAIAVNQNSPMSMMLQALDHGASLEQFEKMMELQERWATQEARKAYVADMAAFKLTPPEIKKTKLVGYTNRDGSVTGYFHATLGEVAAAVVDSLAQHGFSHSWETKQSDGLITVNCKITHRMGHSESTSMQAMPDQSGKKNAIQAVASSITYMQRYTLLAATGLATTDMEDNDGKGFDDGGKPDPDRPFNDEPKPTSLPGYSDAEFSQKLTGWKEVIAAGKKTPATLIDFLKTKATLTPSQINQIQGVAA